MHYTPWYMQITEVHPQISSRVGLRTPDTVCKMEEVRLLAFHQDLKRGRERPRTKTRSETTAGDFRLGLCSQCRGPRFDSWLRN